MSEWQGDGRWESGCGVGLIAWLMNIFSEAPGVNCCIISFIAETHIWCSVP